jgi:hypothetical protein
MGAAALSISFTVALERFCIGDFLGKSCFLRAVMFLH